MVSVAGLAPARLGLKGRLRELLCIDGEIMKTSSSRRDAHGQSLLRKLCNRVVSLLAARVARFVSEEQANACFPLLAPGVGIAPTSRLFQSRANLPQLSGEKLREALRFQSASVLCQSRNATWVIVRLWFSVFMRTRCQNGSVMVAWSLCRTVPRA
jgi:hypothetical protein